MAVSAVSCWALSLLFLQTPLLPCSVWTMPFPFLLSALIASVFLLRLLLRYPPVFIRPSKSRKQPASLRCWEILLFYSRYLPLSAYIGHNTSGMPCRQKKFLRPWQLHLWSLKQFRKRMIMSFLIPWQMIRKMYLVFWVRWRITLNKVIPASNSPMWFPWLWKSCVPPSLNTLLKTIRRNTYSLPLHLRRQAIS